MTRSFTIFCLAAPLITLCACNSPSNNTQQQVAERYVAAPNSVGFDIEPLPANDYVYRWLATYAARGATAKFRIELGSAKSLDGREPVDFDAESGTGRFVAEPGSDAHYMLLDLKSALEAKNLPPRIQRVTTLPFKFVSFGSKQSRSPEGGFFTRPPGNWKPMKIFIGHGDQEGEVFLNVNPVLKMGEFSIKDPDYGDIVLAQLASVL